MSTHTQTTNARLWDFYARCYDAVNESPPYRQLLSSVVSKLDLKSGQKVLDAGCGTGNLEVLISDLGLDLGLDNIAIEAIDNNQGMLDRARKKAVRAKTNFHRADLDQPLPYPNNHFDRVVAIHVLFYCLARSGTYHFLSEPQLRNLLNKTGFSEISVEPAYAGQDWLTRARRP